MARTDDSLLRTRRFAPFFWTQFLGALNDNLFKNALVILFAFGAVVTAVSTDTLVNLAGGLFVLPFFLFSAISGQLADRYDKSRIIRAVKLFEIGIMCLGAAGFALGNAVLLFTALFLMGLHSTLFGPVKYSILPQCLREEELVTGNALVEMGTFVAILVGTIAGGVLVAVPGAGPTIVSAVVIVVAVAGFLVSRAVPAVPAGAPGLPIRWNPLVETWRTIAFARANRTIFLSILGISWFWFYGALFLAQFPGFGRGVLGGDEHVVTLLLTVFSIGVGLGCLLCDRLSGGKIELGLVPFGSIGLSLFALDLALAGSGAASGGVSIGVADFVRGARYWRVAADLALIGAFGGFFIVPLLALVQHRSPPSHRSRIIAGNNIINAAFMVLAALLGIGLRAGGLSIPQLFLFTAVVNAAVAIYIYTLLPEFLMRFIIFLLVHTIYRMRDRGLEHLPAEGPAVLVCNHVSFVDALVIAAACRRPIRFVMDHTIFRLPILRFVFRTARAIPIAPAKEDAAMKERAFEQVAEALEAGELVCIFPEGRLTATGEMGPFRPGVERILARTPVPVVPMALRGLWGSFFSRDGGPAMRRPLRRVWSRIELVCGTPLPASAASVEALQAQVLALRGDWR
jgi:1-acyl-sn-glycerol-3-phosphate acyltransferase